MGLRPGLPFAFLLALTAAASVTLAGPAAMAHGPRPSRPPAPVAKPAVSVSLQSAHGFGLTTVRHRGQTFVAGERGERYEIRITNETASRVEVVVSVDGRDAVSGQLGDFTTQRGYVLEPFGTVVVDGFRTSLAEVAAFRFSSVGESFTGRLGTPQHAGIIGVAVFKEHGGRLARPTAVAPAPMRKSADAAPPSGGGRPNRSESSPSTSSRSGAAAPREAANELGTEFGEQRSSAVREVGFTRANARRPDFTTQIRYDSARGLAARGVPIEVEPVIVHRTPGPDAWPGASSNDRFAQPPPPPTPRWRSR